MKILAVVAISTTGLWFACTPSSSQAGDELRFYDRCKETWAYFQFDGVQVVFNCATQCRLTIPVEIYMLAVSFTLSSMFLIASAWDYHRHATLILQGKAAEFQSTGKITVMRFLADTAGKGRPGAIAQ